MSEKSGRYKVTETEKSELELMLSARFPLIYVVSPEEEIAELELIVIAQSRKSQIYFWDYARGWSEDGQGKGNPMDALGRVAKSSANQSTIFVLKDVASLIAPTGNGQITPAQLPLIREIKNLARDISRDKRTLVLLTHELRLPVELREESTIIDF